MPVNNRNILPLKATGYCSTKHINKQLGYDKKLIKKIKKRIKEIEKEMARLNLEGEA